MTPPRLTPATDPATTGTATCDLCGQTVPLVKVGPISILDRHVIPGTGKPCDGSPVVVW